MSSNLSTLSARVMAIINDPSISSSDITNYLNEGMLQISGGIQRPDSSILTSPLPGLFKISTVIAAIDSNKVSLPEDYQRDLIFVSDSDGIELTVYDSFMDFTRAYPSLSDTGTIVNEVAVMGNFLYYQPIPSTAKTLNVHYYRLPIDMVNGDDDPDGLPSQYHNLLVYYAAKEYFSIVEDGVDGGMVNTRKWEDKFNQMLMRLEASIPQVHSLSYL